jgi:hypothetical protein
MRRKPPTRTHRQTVEAWKKDPEFKAAYDELETEYALLRELIEARRRAGQGEDSSSTSSVGMFPRPFRA